VEILDRISKHKAIFIASLLLFLFAGARISGFLLKNRTLPAQPTVAPLALSRPANDSLDAQLAREFWTEGKRDFFQPPHAETRTARNAEKEKEDKQAAGNEELIPPIAGEDRQQNHDGLELAETQEAAAPPFELPYNFKAVVHVDTIFAVLEDKQTGTLTRCSVGDCIDGLTVVSIDRASIKFEDADGRPYQLKDAFGRKYDSNGTGRRM